MCEHIRYYRFYLFKRGYCTRCWEEELEILAVRASGFDDPNVVLESVLRFVEVSPWK